MNAEPDISTIGALVGVPARTAMLQALADGRALPASELAWRAYVSPQTASAHLAKMVAGGLLKVERCGRHRYYAIANQDVAQIIEHMMVLAPPARMRDRHDHAQVDPLREGRTCYGHLAGRMGVALVGGLCESGFLRLEGDAYRVTRGGRLWFADLGVDLQALEKMRRSFARRCIDWSERVPHLGGALGDALTARLFEADWLRRAPRGRAVRVTERGRQHLRTMLGVRL
ncbi:MAG: transcriptional regulator [Candidimonas sp.]|nr:MAG: transcriptional regulator [Candidimonas sp.]